MISEEESSGHLVSPEANEELVAQEAIEAREYYESLAGCTSIYLHICALTVVENTYVNPSPLTEWELQEQVDVEVYTALKTPYMYGGPNLLGHVGPSSQISWYDFGTNSLTIEPLRRDTRIDIRAVREECHTKIEVVPTNHDQPRAVRVDLPVSTFQCIVDEVKSANLSYLHLYTPLERQPFGHFGARCFAVHKVFGANAQAPTDLQYDRFDPPLGHNYVEPDGRR